MGQEKLDRKEKCWLVKSNGKILGPLSFDEMVDKVLTREIVVLDECIKNLGRWKFVRDEQQFVKAIEELRSHPPLGEETKTEGLSSNTQTITETADIDLDRTNIGRYDRKPTSNIVDADFKEYSTATDEKISDEPMKRYGYGSDSQLKSDVRKSSKNLWIFLALLLVALAYFVLEQKNKQKKGVDKNSFEYLSDSGLRAYRYGEYDKAFSLLSQGAEKRTTDVDLKLQLAPLFIRNNELTQAQRLLQEVLAVRYQDDYSKQVNVGLGLTYLIDQDYSNAEKYFKSSLKVDGNYLPANFNMGMVSFFKNDTDAAINFFQKARDLGSAEAALMLAKTYIRKAKAGSNEKFYQMAANEIEKLINKSFDYRQKAFLMASYIAYLQNREIGIKSFADRFLSTDPQMDQDHVHSLLLYRDELSWDRLFDWCTQVYNSDRTSNRMLALYAICQYQAKKRIEGLKSFESATTGSKDDGLIFANFSYFLEQFNDPNRSGATLSLAMKSSGSEPLVQLIKARNCYKAKDLECAKRYFGQVSSLPAFVLPAKVGLAQVALQSGEESKASGLINDVRNISSNYAPGLRLSDELALR